MVWSDFNLICPNYGGKLEKARLLQAGGQEIRILDEVEALALLPVELRWRFSTGR